MADIQAAPDLQTLQMATSLYESYTQWIEAGKPKRTQEESKKPETEASWKQSW